MRDEDKIDMQEAEEKHEAMDYAQHEGTWFTFTNLVKWAIIELAFLVLALFCFIQAGQVALGWTLIVVGLLAIPGWYFFGPKRPPVLG
jgi:hypothetical protein